MPERLRPGSKRSGSPLKLVEAGLWFAAFLCFACLIGSRLEAKSAQHRANRLLASAAAPTADNPRPQDKSGAVIGRLEIAKLGFSVPMLENYDPDTLRKGVGHVPGTAVPGGLGNLVLAGHRDTFFRPLRKIEPGMVVEIVSPDGRWRYSVDRTEVVTPDQVGILDIGDRPEMTLITCYPFDFIGAAPKRFIVHAHLLSVDATR